jgi:formate hydrogenlyase subunit 6/NADH:ubiquinone oxidoreductase subunit I
MPVWQAGVPCYFCYACFNFCPEQAILLKIYTKKNGRYHYPTITADEIARQKTSEILSASVGAHNSETMETTS